MKDLYDYFERRARDDGETFVTLTDDHPDWLYDAVHDAHDGEGPNDWRYEMCRQIAGAIDDGELTDPDDVSEFADAAVDIYNTERLRWLAGDLSRVAYVDEARDEGLIGDRADTVEQIGVGQYLCIERMAHVMLDAWLDNKDDDEDDEDEEEDQ